MGQLFFTQLSLSIAKMQNLRISNLIISDLFFFDFKLNNCDHAKPECDGAYEYDIHNKDTSCDFQLCD